MTRNNTCPSHDEMNVPPQFIRTVLEKDGSTIKSMTASIGDEMQLDQKQEKLTVWGSSVFVSEQIRLGKCP